MITFETFRQLKPHDLSSFTELMPSVWNGVVSFRKYRVTVEEIPESVDVLRERLSKLWRETDNFHHFGPLRAAAKEIGIELSHEELGKDSPRRKGK